MQPVIAIDASFPMETVLAYMVGVVFVFDFIRNQKAFNVNDQHSIKIMDFGRGELPPNPMIFVRLFKYGILTRISILVGYTSTPLGSLPPNVQVS